MDINTVIIIIEKNDTEFNLFQFIIIFCLFVKKLITPCDITEYCIVELNQINSFIKFFIFQLICILAKMVITFKPVRIFNAVFNAVLRRTNSTILSMSCFLRWGLFKLSITSVVTKRSWTILFRNAYHVDNE